ncbi:DUF1392 family protein [Nostoc sp. MG11]|uniref:DUF1392 family protein n=1 Tax=Nostoc sp. MG11 TaxID=2721166 RepID=UPI0018678916|nr:DUF1392 family protein [Nostoc sp. MG11]
MIDQINALYLCWYLSPPWGYCIPRVEVNLLERVYICTIKTFGYCCGIRWEQGRWIYAVVCNEDIIYTTEHEIIGTGKMQLAAIEKPAFVLGDRVMLRSDDEGTRQRIVLGTQLLNRTWFYYVEWMPSALEEVTTLDDRLVFVSQLDLVRVLY